METQRRELTQKRLKQAAKTARAFAKEAWKCAASDSDLRDTLDYIAKGLDEADSHGMEISYYKTNAIEIELYNYGDYISHNCIAEKGTLYIRDTDIIRAEEGDDPGFSQKLSLKARFLRSRLIRQIGKIIKLMPSYGCQWSFSIEETPYMDGGTWYRLINKNINIEETAEGQREILIEKLIREIQLEIKEW